MNQSIAHDPKTARCGQARGFTLIEVLVTVAVTMVALAGLATLQMLSLRAADSALDRTQATALAYEMMDRMRLNLGDRRAPATSSALGGVYDDKILCNGEACDIGAVNCASTPPTGATRADLDLREWWCALAAAELPGWRAAIRQAAGMFNVSVQWDDSRAEADPDAAASETSCLGTDLPAATQEVCVTTQL